ncbi:MAPEG family protein [Algiphilus sp.]|nr:MAPEG family protein [Algiphilus sp.]MBY8965232.1 MAPEG family protein [Algiphilus acroporae]MCI5063634.1 MAPEG family protein [Algiphilus sp.]MCI5104823.1 MAPEG family protein [Algiphilus sp.]
MLLGFALWTIAVLLFSVGIYRWTRILSGKVDIKAFRGDVVEGEDWYRRAMRAHANCVENLPVFGAVVFAVYASGLQSSAVDIMAAVALLARMCQSVIHIALVQSNTIAFLRFVFFFTQLVCFIGMAISVMRYAL